MKLQFALVTFVAPAASSRLLKPSKGKPNIEYDAEVTPGMILGTGVGNGFFKLVTFQDPTTGAEGEIGLRGKFRWPSPQNLYNSNGDGTYSFEAGRPNINPTTWNYPSPEWSYEWHINTHVGCDSDTGSCQSLDSYEYELFVDSDPSMDQTGVTIDPINDYNADPRSSAYCWDHSLGSGSTPASGGVEAGYTASSDCALDANEDFLCCTSAYHDWIGAKTVAQNSWQPNWFIGNFNPEVKGVYNIVLRVLTKNVRPLKLIAEVKIRIEADDGTGFPTQMNDCKDWQNYGDIFRSNKDCHSFVKKSDLN
jgi:hypothetical protein